MKFISIFIVTTLLTLLNVSSQEFEELDHVSSRMLNSFHDMGLTTDEQEAYLNVLNELDVQQPRPIGFNRKMILEETSAAQAKKFLAFGLGVSSAIAWSIIFSSNDNIGYFLIGGKNGESADSFAFPISTIMFIPSTAIVYELLDDLTAGFEKPHNKKEVLRLAARVANLGFAAQGIVGDVAVFGRVSWYSPYSRVRNSVDGGTYYLAGTYVLTNLLDRISMGNGVIDWAYNRIQYRMNRNAEDNLLKKNIVAELQSQLRHAYQNVVDMDDEQALCTRRQIGQLYRGTKTDAGKQQAKLQSLLLLMGLGNAGAETMWTPQKKPFSLKAAKAFFGSLGFTLGYGATLGTYWAFDEDNRFDSS